MKWVSSIAVVAALGVAAFLLWGPGGTRPLDDPAPKVQVGSGDFPRSVTDSGGHVLTLPRRPARIVSTAPSNTEILFALGAGPRVVGVTTTCSFPPEAAKIDTIGGFTPKSISIERIVGSRPDLVLTTGRLQQPLTESLRQVRLNVLSYDAKTLEDVIGNVRAIGRATDHDDAADKLAKSLERRLARIRQHFGRLAKADRPKALLLLTEEPLMVAGPKTFAGQLVELAGGRNVFPEVAQQFPRVSEEEIIKRNPDVILIWQRGGFAERKARLRQRPGWNQLAAFRNDRILNIDEDVIYRAGPRLFDGLEQLATMLNPAAAKAAKAAKETTP